MKLWHLTALALLAALMATHWSHGWAVLGVLFLVRWGWKLSRRSSRPARISTRCRLSTWTLDECHDGGDGVGSGCVLTHAAHLTPDEIAKLREDWLRLAPGMEFRAAGMEFRAAGPDDPWFSERTAGTPRRSRSGYPLWLLGTAGYWIGRRLARRRR